MNVSLGIFSGTTFVANQTHSVTQNNTRENFTITLPEGQTNWTCRATDSDNSIGQASTNRSINVNSSAPTLCSDSPIVGCVAQYGFLGLLPSCTVISGGLSTSYLYTGGNSTIETISCTLDGYNPLISTYNIVDGDKNFTMTDLGLKLNFMLFNGTSQSVVGFIKSNNGTFNFSGSSININVTSLEKGRVEVYFGYNTSIMNYTQFYQFNNDWTTDASENITLISRDIKYPFYVKVKDEGQYIINDALVRIDASDPTVGRWNFIGQRFTGQEEAGMTYF